MKISYAIHSSDSSSLYLDFWPIVSEIWAKRFGITPILIYIDDDTNKIIDETYGKVYRISPIKNQPINLQNQIVRFWFPIKFKDEVSIISDIDMLPLSSEYFIEQVSKLSYENYIHLNPCIEDYGRLPVCYHIATGQKFQKVLEIENDWEEFYFKVIKEGYLICKKNNLPNWFCDESYTSNKVLNYSNLNDVKLIYRKGGQNGYRIDRSNWHYNKWLLNYDYYFDLHSLRPFNDNKIEIQNIKKMILESKKRKPYSFEIIIFRLLSKFFKN